MYLIEVALGAAAFGGVGAVFYWMEKKYSRKPRCPGCGEVLKRSPWPENVWICGYPKTSRCPHC